MFSNDCQWQLRNQLQKHLAPLSKQQRINQVLLQSGSLLSKHPVFSDARGFTTTPVISVKLYPQMSCISPAAWASPMVLSNVSIASLVSCKWQVGWTSPVGGKVKDEVSRPVVLARSSPWPSCELVPHQTEASWDLRFHKNPWWPMVIHGDPWQYPLKSASQTKTCVDTSCVLNYWAANALHRLSPILSAISRAWSTASIAFRELADPS